MRKNISKQMIKKEETTSFVIRFTQKIFADEAGESQVQWRSHIRHVQTGKEQRFSDFSKAVEFIQNQLADLTLQGMEDKPEEEQQGILEKSLNLWKKMAMDYPKKVIETIKDPKAQVEQLQSQVSQVGEAISQSLETEMNQWRGASKSDVSELLTLVKGLAADMTELKAKVNKIADKDN
ncbi:MAG: hypothetical protein AB8B69_27360 [Chitinophagales bacterium]